MKHLSSKTNLYLDSIDSSVGQKKSYAPVQTKVPSNRNEDSSSIFFIIKDIW